MAKRQTVNYVPSGLTGICAACRRHTELLVPDRRQGEQRRQHSGGQATATTSHDNPATPIPRVPKIAAPRATRAPRPRFLYAVKDRRKTVKDLPPAQADAYKALCNHTMPMSVRDVATASEHPKETTQQLLAALVKAGYATRTPSTSGAKDF